MNFNPCILQIVNDSIHISFDQIVEEATLSVWTVNANQKNVLEKRLLNTNFETVQLNLPKGKYKFKIDYKPNQYTKILSV